MSNKRAHPSLILWRAKYWFWRSMEAWHKYRSGKALMNLRQHSKMGQQYQEMRVKAQMDIPLSYLVGK